MPSKDSFKAKVSAPVISGCILAAIIFTASRVWPAFSKWIIDLWCVIFSILAAKAFIPVWALIMLFVSATIPVFQIFMALRRNKPPELTWRDFRNNFYFGLCWNWSYGFNGSIIHLSAFCPKCSLALIIDPHRIGSNAIQTDFICDDCGKIGAVAGDNIDVWNKVMRKIERDITTDQWKNKYEDDDATIHCEGSSAVFKHD